MNRASEILDYLAKSKEAERLLIAPMAPPVARTATGMTVALNRILDATDVSDTLAAIRTRAVGTEGGDMASTGFFAFGLKDVGRFRVTYVTQRGSKVFSIARVRIGTPHLDALCPDAGAARQLRQLFEPPVAGVLMVTGPHLLSAALLAYALLHHVNHTQRRIIQCVERCLSCLLSHDNSVVVQVEVGIDVPSLDDGVALGLPLVPDIVYLSDARTAEDLLAAATALEGGALVVLAVHEVNASHLLRVLHTDERDRIRNLAAHLKGVARIQPLPADTYRTVFTAGLPPQA